MPGNKANVRFWDEIDVHVSDDLSLVLPTLPEDPLPAGFDRAGLITPDGFNKSREEEVNDHYAFGRDGLIGETRKNFKESWGFAFLEDNDVTYGLIYPGSTQTKVIVPKPKQLNVVFTLRNSGTGYSERWRTANYAKIGVDGEIAMNDSDPTATSMTATIFALDASDTEPDPVLYERQVVAGEGEAGAQAMVAFGDHPTEPADPTGDGEVAQA